ncbi:MAG TPA: ribosome maturation factor RimP [Gemmatimonadaceae bacterium]|nr:ribosome maturation factor RimP [Gemmatimonadaceae bacterium]
MNDDLERVVASEVDAIGYELVELRRGGTRGRPLIEVRIDRRDGQNVTVDDCAKVSRAIEGQLDGSALVAERYVLQVSSPGDRPLRTAQDWRRFVGRWASVSSSSHGGRLEGKIIAVEGEEGTEAVVLELDRGVQRRVPLAEIQEARLAFHW